MPELNFDSNKIEPVGSFEPVPVGDYIAVISASEKKANSKGTGEFLQLTYTIVDGEFKGRKIFDRLNIRNDNTQAQEIAQRTLSAICHIVNVPHPKMSEELHDKPMMITVAIRPAKGEYAESNIIKAWKYPDGTKLQKAGGSVAAKAENTAAPDGKKKKPWEK